MAKYRLLTAAFMEPNLLKEGTVFEIDDSWEPGPHVEPLDDAAKAALEAYYKKKPEASINPVEALPMTTGYAIVEEKQPAPQGTEDQPLSLAEAGSAKAEAGPTDGGKVK